MSGRKASRREIAKTNDGMLRRQRQFGLAAEYAARAFVSVPGVEKVALFGSVAQPLHEEVPRFRESRRAGVALARQRDRLRHMTSAGMCFEPIPALVSDLDRNPEGWAKYLRFGYHRVAFRQTNRHVRHRLVRHLRRRSQRRYRPPKGVSFYRHLADLGLVYL